MLLLLFIDLDRQTNWLSSFSYAWHYPTGPQPLLPFQHRLRNTTRSILLYEEKLVTGTLLYSLRQKSLPTRNKYACFVELGSFCQWTEMEQYQVCFKRTAQKVSHPCCQLLLNKWFIEYLLFRNLRAPVIWSKYRQNKAQSNWTFHSHEQQGKSQRTGKVLILCLKNN